MLALQYPAVMGILNVTPDSFSDGGRYLDLGAAVQHATAMMEEGADIIDIGGESTRPGAEPVSPGEEIKRVIPVIERIRAAMDIPVSVDTSTPEVMLAAAAAGADLINDVRALTRKGALQAAASTGLPVCIMHMKGDPQTMQVRPEYADLLGEIRAFFEERMECCEKAGIPREKIILDPGIGFGKTPEHNLTLINRVDFFAPLGRPVLVGLSRKSTIAKIVSGTGPDLLFGSVAGAVMAVARGASIVRVHDVGPTVAAIRVTGAVTSERLQQQT
jgi:dihydropteroate synthase